MPEPIDVKAQAARLREHARLLDTEKYASDQQMLMVGAALVSMLSAADALEAIEKERAEAMTVLAPNMPESGLVDACRQVKQAAVTWEGNCEAVDKEREALREALIWCSGSDDFNEGGKAREGWLRLCAPLLAAREGR